MKTYTILLLATALMVGCKPKQETPAVSEDVKAEDVVDAEAAAQMIGFDKEVPDACTLLDSKFIANVFGIDPSVINVKDGSSSQNKKARSCFFKWDTDLPNSGILVQALKNPVEDEFPEWVTYFVRTKKEDGEKSFSEPGVVYRYKDWKAAGDEGAASTEAGKYVWRVGDEMAFMIAFNLTIDPAKQEQAATALAQEVMANL
jgi:hypothetical protein